MLSATDAFPDGTPAQLRSQPMGDLNFSDIEDEDSSDDSAFHFSAPAALADDAAMIPATTAATAAGRPSAICLSLNRAGLERSDFVVRRLPLIFALK